MLSLLQSGHVASGGSGFWFRTLGSSGKHSKFHNHFFLNHAELQVAESLDLHGALQETGSGT